MCLSFCMKGKWQRWNTRINTGLVWKWRARWEVRVRPVVSCGGFVLHVGNKRENWERVVAAINATAWRAGPFQKCERKVDKAKRTPEIFLTSVIEEPLFLAASQVSDLTRKARLRQVALLLLLILKCSGSDSLSAKRNGTKWKITGTITNLARIRCFGCERLSSQYHSSLIQATPAASHLDIVAICCCTQRNTMSGY